MFNIVLALVGYTLATSSKDEPRRVIGGALLATGLNRLLDSFEVKQRVESDRKGE